jgi:hypothetical protein
MLTGALMLAAQSAGFAQGMRGWEIGPWLGASTYFGDLNTNWRLNRMHPAGGFGARYNFNDRLCLRFGANVGQISATDNDSKNIYENRRNLEFRSLIVDGTMQLEFNFMPYIHGSRDYFYTPYLFLGPCVYHFNPRTQYDGKWYNLVELGTEGQFKGEEYSLTQLAFTYGLGFKIDLSYRWSLNVDVSGRRLFTDYLDDVSGVYADVRDIRALRGDIAAELSDRSDEPKIGQPGRQRGNGKRDDMYATVGIGVLYYFGDIRCPAFLR